jgi:hypothetical protein
MTMPADDRTSRVLRPEPAAQGVQTQAASPQHGLFVARFSRKAISDIVKLRRLLAMAEERVMENFAKILGDSWGDESLAAPPPPLSLS